MSSVELNALDNKDPHSEGGQLNRKGKCGEISGSQIINLIISVCGVIIAIFTLYQTLKQGNDIDSIKVQMESNLRVSNTALNNMLTALNEFEKAKNKTDTTSRFINETLQSSVISLSKINESIISSSMLLILLNDQSAILNKTINQISTNFSDSVKLTLNLSTSILEISNNLNNIINNNKKTMSFKFNNILYPYATTHPVKLSGTSYIFPTSVLLPTRYNISINGNGIDCWQAFDTVNGASSQFGSVGVPSSGYTPEIYLRCDRLKVAYSRCANDDPFLRDLSTSCDQSFELTDINNCLRTSVVTNFRTNIILYSSLENCF